MYMYKISNYKKKCMGSSKDTFFTFRIWNAESKTEFANNSANSPKNGKPYFHISLYS